MHAKVEFWTVSTAHPLYEAEIDLLLSEVGEVEAYGTEAFEQQGSHTKMVATARDKPDL